jgi:hypothetical protein
MGIQNDGETGSGSRRATKTAGFILAVIGLIIVLTWAVSVFFEMAIVKSLAAVILAVFLIVIGLIAAGVT